MVKVENIKEFGHGILNLLKQDEHENELERKLTWEDNVHRHFGKVENCFEEFKTWNSSIVSHDSSSSERSISQVKIKLPKLRLAKSRGHITQR